MTLTSLIKLVNSLSRSEKRYFKMHSQLQAGNKEYLILFDLLEKNKNLDLKNLKLQFYKKSPAGSWDNSCTYLASILLESLVKSKKEKDPFFDLLHQIQEAKVLTERSLDNEAFKHIKKVREKAAQLQLHWIEYYCYRYELNYYSDNNFPGQMDDSLIRLQMKGKDVLKNLNHIHDHYSLYELLKFRLIHAGKIVSEEGKKKLNDLVLSEMVLVGGKAKSFSSQKLHLLFQAYFFTDVGDYKSAVKSFYKLNQLLQDNLALLDNPPFDYLSALNGMMDSLRMLNESSDVNDYLARIKNLDQPFYPEFFRYLVKKTFCTQQIVTFLQSGQLLKAEEFVKSIPSEVFDSYVMVDEEKQSELYFYCSLANFQRGDFKKAHLFIREVMNSIRLPEQLLVSKAIRLLNIVVYFEKGELIHLEYEIRSYKRFFVQSRSLKIEKLLFKIISSPSVNKRIRLAPIAERKILQELENIKEDRYEQQLLRYFDFSVWAKNLIGAKGKKTTFERTVKALSSSQ
jgi:hypothetical protein